MVLKRPVQFGSCERVIHPWGELVAPTEGISRQRATQNNIENLPFEVMPSHGGVDALRKFDDLVCGSEVEQVWFRLNNFPFHCESMQTKSRATEVRFLIKYLLSFSGVKMEY